jgi:hypothetical protein
MTKPIIQTAKQPLVHHPSDVLDLFGRYDATSTPWIAFDRSLSEQLTDLEEKNRRYWTPKTIRRSIGR